MEEGESPNVINISLSSQKSKFIGMGNQASIINSQPSTLEESVPLTIKRDLMAIYNKTLCVFSTTSDANKLDELRRNWDLWGPLLISLAITALVTLGSYNDNEELFTNLFVVLWIGPFIISLNCRLLGARISLMQSVSLIIYCTAPILVLAFVVFVTRLLYQSFLLNLGLSTIAIYFTLRGAQFYFRTLVGQDKRFMVLYPILLFYVFLTTYISMAQ